MAWAGFGKALPCPKSCLWYIYSDVSGTDMFCPEEFFDNAQKLLFQHLFGNLGQRYVFMRQSKGNF